MNRAYYFLIGIAAGAVAGLLYAPQAGRRTRTQIASKTKRSRRFLREHSAGLRDNVTDTFGRSRLAVSKSIREFMG